MNRQNSVLLGLVVLISLVAWLFAPEKASTEFKTEKVFPELLGQLDQINSVMITSGTDTLLDASKVDSNWVANNRGDYPTQAQSVVELLNDLASADLDEAKTANSENYYRLGVNDVDAQDSVAKLIILRGTENEWSILVGNTASSGAGIYIRKPDEAQSWLTKTFLNLPTDDTDWLKSDILDVDKQYIASISRLGNETWQITRQISETDEDSSELAEAASSWTVTPNPNDLPLQYSSILDSFVDDLVGLSFSDLIENSEFEQKGLKSLIELEISLEDGTKILLQLFEEGEEHFARFTSPMGGNYWQDWTYQISSFASTQLSKTVSDFLKEPEPETSESEAAGAEGSATP